MAQTAMQELWEWIDANCHEESFNLNSARETSLSLERAQLLEEFAKGYSSGYEDGYEEGLTGEE